MKRRMNQTQASRPAHARRHQPENATLQQIGQQAARLANPLADL
jgi:hypothetical protein